MSLMTSNSKSLTVTIRIAATTVGESDAAENVFNSQCMLVSCTINNVSVVVLKSSFLPPQTFSRETAEHDERGGCTTMDDCAQCA